MQNMNKWTIENYESHDRNDNDGLLSSLPFFSFCFRNVVRLSLFVVRCVCENCTMNKSRQFHSVLSFHHLFFLHNLVLLFFSCPDV